MTNKNVSIIGAGKLGLCFGLNLKKVGYNVTAMDNNTGYIDMLKNNTFSSSEPEVNDYLAKYPLEYTNRIEDCLKNNIIFIVVATPSTKDYKYDHTAIDQVCEELMKFGVQKVRKDLIINCTTFPGYCELLGQKMKPFNYAVSYNPEFIAQGTILHDQVNCDNVLIGKYDQFAADLIKNIYDDFVNTKPIYNIVSPTEAELIKLSVNCFLTTKISYANMIGDIALRFGCDPISVLKAIGTDSRIGNKYLGYGFGFGGPCFPRDNRALAKCGEEVGIEAVISIATDRMNELHLNYQISDFISKNTDKNKVIDFDFITYKKESISLEESQRYKFVKALHDLGYRINLLDTRHEMKELKEILYK